MDPDVAEQIEAMKPKRAALFLLMPVVSVAAVIGLYALTFAVGVYGRPASGERVQLQFDGCPAARPMVQARVQAMGLGDPVWTDTAAGFGLAVTLPADPRVADGIPATLVAPGVLRGVVEDEPERVLITNAQVASASIRQDLTMIPWTVLELTADGREVLLAYGRERRDGRVAYALDGVPMGVVSNLQGVGAEVELTPAIEDDRARLERAAADAIVLGSGPLPCPTTVHRHPAG